MQTIRQQVWIEPFVALSGWERPRIVIDWMNFMRIYWCRYKTSTIIPDGRIIEASMKMKFNTESETAKCGTLYFYKGRWRPIAIVARNLRNLYIFIHYTILRSLKYIMFQNYFKAWENNSQSLPTTTWIRSCYVLRYDINYDKLLFKKEPSFQWQSPLELSVLAIRYWDKQL